MPEHEVNITNYSSTDREGVLRLLLELHDTYFKENVPSALQEISQEHDIAKSYSDYLDEIAQNLNNTWQIYIAKTAIGQFIGFIIGSIETDKSLVFDKTGKFEDWYVAPAFRNQGKGQALYNALEAWFKEKGCQRVLSDTWLGNQLSIDAHLKAGFFVSGVMFSKKIV